MLVEDMFKSLIVNTLQLQQSLSSSKEKQELACRIWGPRFYKLPQLSAGYNHIDLGSYHLKTQRRPEGKCQCYYIEKLEGESNSGEAQASEERIS